jgi:serpin B
MKKLLLYAMTVAVLTGCSSNNDNENNEVVNMLPETRGIELTQEQREFVNKNTDFSFNRFRTISQMPAGQKGSIVSPISVIYMMGMLNTSAGPSDPPMNVDFHANHPFVYVI